MTVNELLEALEELAEDGHGDTELRLATQPNWPLAFHLRGVVPNEDAEYWTDHDEGDGGDHHEGEKLVWLVEGGSVYDDPYAPRWVFEAV